MVTRIVATGVLLAALIRPALPAPVSAVAIPALRFRTFIRTGLQLGAVLWDGRRFLYTVEGGRVIVGTDLGANLYAVQPRGAGYQASPIGTNLRSRSYNLERASYIDNR